LARDKLRRTNEAHVQVHAACLECNRGSSRPCLDFGCVQHSALHNRRISKHRTKIILLGSKRLVHVWEVRPAT
jgi:hypothetical protein